MRLVHLFVLSTVSATVVAGESPVRIRVLYSPTANLAYQLDAVSGSLPHLDARDYRALWEREFLKSPKDREMLVQWSDLQRKYAAMAPLEAGAMPFQAPDLGVTLGERIRVAGLRAQTEREFLEDASLLMLAPDAARLAEVYRHFAPTFTAWWKRAGGAGQAFVRQVDQLLKSEPVRGDIERFHRFYAPAIPTGSDVVFSLVVRPNMVAAPTSGQQIDNVGVVEFLPNEKAEQRLDVVVHEFCHYLYGARSEAANLSLQRRFAATDDPAAKPAFNLLNEGLATALGNGVIGRRFASADRWAKILATPRSLYNQPNVDLAGKSSLRFLDSWLTAGKSIDDPTFVPTYLSSLREALGPSLTRPALFLGEAFIFVHSQFGKDYARSLRQSLGVFSAYTSVADSLGGRSLAEYRDQPTLSAVFVVPRELVPELVSQELIEQADASALSAEGGALFSAARSPHAHSFIIVANDAQEADVWLKKLMEAPALFTGPHK